jgi:predicted SAM-dependent methyltransferase
MKKELLIGCGSNHKKQIIINNDDCFQNVVTLDNNADHNPDVVWDLTQHPLPFSDNEFDEIHAYEVLEHLAYQGDYKFFFSEFSEYWRILKNGGRFVATVPSRKSRWAFGDPSHKRVIVLENLGFLSQKQYEGVGRTCVSDFRSIYKADYNLVWLQETDEQLQFILEAIK